MRPADLAFEQLRRANPVPDPAALRRELAGTVETDEEREITMSTITTDSPKRARNRRPRRWVLLAAVVVLMLGGATTIFLATDPAPTPVEIAEAYIDARNAYDVEGARELVSEDFTTTEPPDGWRDVEGMELAFRQHEAYGFHYSETDCDLPMETSAGIEVACDFLWTIELHRIGNFPPSELRFTFYIEGDRITRIAAGTHVRDDLWEPWIAFLRSEHPEFRGVVDRALVLDPDSVGELVEQLPRYLDLYEEWVDSQDG
jgi:hypothetical protein